MGVPENGNGNTLYNNVENEKVNFNSFSLGVKLGILLFNKVKQIEFI